MKNFSQFLKKLYIEQPDKKCLYLLQTNQPDKAITYKDLLMGAAGYAKEYERRGINSGEVIILILQHGVDLIYAYFGAILHGSIPSIMPFLTEKLLPERYRADLASLIAITKPTGIVTYSDFEGEINKTTRIEDSVREIILVEKISKSIKPDFKLFGGMNRDQDEIVLLQHSSGSTGLQKGVALSHRAVLNQLESYGSVLGLNQEKDVIVSWLPLYHDMGLIACFLMPILMNISLVLISPFDWVRAPHRLLEAVSKYKGTLSWLPNFAYNFCALKIRDRYLENIDLSSWRAVINCSEPMRWESHEIFINRFQDYGLSELALSTCYAMAENVFAVTQSIIGEPVNVDLIDRESYQSKKEAIVATERPSVKMLSAGKVIPGVKIRILNEIGETLPERNIGEIALYSDCMLTGYYNRPNESRKAFMKEWYLTGDFGYIADDELYITGRKKDLIIVGGKNVYPQDIEQIAMEVPGVHPGRVVAFGLFNESVGTEDVILIAETKEVDQGKKDWISNKIREVVTTGSAVALRRVVLVDNMWLIKTSSGKIARSANRDKYIKEFQE